MEDPMLRRSTDDHVLSVPPTVKENGYKARHRRPPLSATEAALIAWTLVNGRLTSSMACRLTGANRYYFNLINAMDGHERDQLSRGGITLAAIQNARAKRNGNGKSAAEPVAETLFDRLQRYTAAELVATAKSYGGVSKFFDAVINPVLYNTDVIVTEVKATDV
jgi:hypothetical protein